MEADNLREILFRGKRVDNGEWICSGNLITFNQGNGEPNLLNFIPERNAKCVCTHDEADNIIGFEDCLFAKVIPDTVGQYTGIDDRNGKKIFEGDIVSFTRINALGYTTKRVGTVKYYDKLPIFYIMATTGDAWDWVECGDIEVIGNIHDNPELLEVLK